MIIVLDTNVLFQALRNTGGASYYILNLIRKQKVVLALSTQVFTEYETVLKRKTSLKELGLALSNINDVLRFLAFICKPINPWFLFRPNLKDENDNMFVELAVASNCDFLITSNIRDFEDSELQFDNFIILTPAEFVKKWRKNHD